MWAIRMLSGPHAGQIFNLKSGKNRLGRAPNADIYINGQGVSKEHLEIQVFSDKILVTDLRSSNGTFLNGVRVQNSLVKLGDKIGAHNILFEVIATSTTGAVAQSGPRHQMPAQQMPMQVRPQTLASQQYSPQTGESAPEASRFTPGAKPQLSEKIKRYTEDVILPGVYRLVQVFDFKVVVYGFGALFIFCVTLLTVFPMKQITSESTHIESRRRAQTVARALAQANEKVIRNGDLSHFSVDFVIREDGIDDVYIVSKDGSIIAPADRVGSRPKQTGFIKLIQGQNREIAAEISSSRVAAAYPIVSFDPEMQQNVARAYAVVVFNTGSLQFDDAKALSLFIQMFLLAGVLGSFVFFLIFKLIERPWLVLNQELDAALRENRDHVDVEMKFSSLQPVLVNINSLLSRALNPQSSPVIDNTFQRDGEMRNLAEVIGYPALVFKKTGYVIALNSSFQALTGIQSNTLIGQALKQIPDQALQKNIENLAEQVRAQPQQICSDSFEIGGHPLKIHCQAFIGSGSEIEYFIVTLTPLAEEQGGAA